MPDCQFAGQQRAFFGLPPLKQVKRIQRLAIGATCMLCRDYEVSFMYYRKEITARSFAVEQKGISIVKV